MDAARSRINRKWCFKNRLLLNERPVTDFAADEPGQTDAPAFGIGLRMTVCDIQPAVARVVGMGNNVVESGLLTAVNFWYAGERRGEFSIFNDVHPAAF